jgi:hypothetical protein
MTPPRKGGMTSVDSRLDIRPQMVAGCSLLSGDSTGELQGKTTAAAPSRHTAAAVVMK